MNRRTTSVGLLVALALWSPCLWSTAAVAEPCADPAKALGVSRIIEIDSTTGPLFGYHSRFTREASFLGPKEVVITIDDGPLPAYTRPILDALDAFCTKATFFAVGKMALAYPAMIKEEMARGHTVGTHTWTHPMNIGKLSLDRGIDQIERGHAAVTLAAGQPIAPFFRFPGLNDSDPLLAHLQTRGIAAFTVDAISNDSYIKDPDRLLAHTMREVEKYNGGIILFHDIKASTAKAMPAILKALKDGGYKVVHLKAKGTSTPIAEIEADLKPQLAKLAGADPETGATHQLQPFYATISLLKPETSEAPEMTALAPEARPRTSPGRVTTSSISADGDGTSKPRRNRARKAEDDDQRYTGRSKQKRNRLKKAANADGQGPLFTYGN
jgi:peptidoglycan-N-acetylglucosamine deacetylase